MSKIFLLTFAFLLAVFSISAIALAVDVKNPQNVEYMKAEITQSGSVSVGDVSELNLSLYIPQSDSSQTAEIQEVSNADYFIEKDKFGNRKINMFWKNPPNPVTFKVKTAVTINRRTSGNFYSIGDFSKPTELIQSTDPEIKALAESIVIGKKTDFDKISSLTKWVNENIEYDLAYSDVNLSATTVLHLRKGVCDEFSTLLLSMARALGYKASYVVGFAYGKGYTFSEGDFAAHGWTEIYTPSGTIISDPTWGEIPVDASHIRFASLADSIYPEVNVSGIGKNPSMKINPITTNISILEVRENPILKANSFFIEPDVWKGYAVARTDISAPDCALTKVSEQSCITDGGQLLQPEQNDTTIYFCGNKTLFSIFKLPDNLDEKKIYTCPVTIAAYNANQNTINLKLHEKPEGSVKLFLDKNVAEEGEKITAYSPDAYIFTSFGQYWFDSATFEANDNVIVYAYNDGALEKQEVRVVKEKPFEIIIRANANYTVNETGFVSITVRNLLQKSQSIALDFRNSTQQIYLESLSEKTLNLSFVPVSAGDNFLQAYASVPGFNSYASKLIDVQEKPKTWWDNIMESITNFFRSVSETIGNFFSSLSGPR